MQQTLVLFKPDAIQRGLAGEILSRLERKGLKVVAMKMIWMDEALAKRHYAIHEGKPFFSGLVDFITSSPLIAAVVEAENAVELVRRTMGETDPTLASPGTIRGDLALDIGHNLIHGSDSEANAEKEIGFFFTREEILSYPRDTEKWITGS